MEEGTAAAAEKKTTKTVAEVYVDPFQRDELLNKLALDYAKYLEMPEKARSELQAIEQTIDSMLTRLAELDALINTTSPEIDSTADTVLPLLTVKTKQMEALFYMIEKLETFVQAVNNSVVQMEEAMDESERLFDEVNPTSIQKALSLFKWRPAGATHVEQHKVMPPWKPVPIVDSDELLALKTNLNAQFNDIATGSLYALE